MENKKGFLEELEETEEIETDSEEISAEDYLKIALSKTYKFEGKEISELDLNKLEELTGADILAINRMMKKRGNADTTPELTMEFAFYAAMRACKLPLEFFHGLSMKDSMKVKTRVNYFLIY